MKKNLSFIAAVVTMLCIIQLAAGAKDTYKIIYDFGVASVKSEEIVNSNPDSFTAGESITLAEPTCPGFEFEGWYLENDYRTAVDSIDTSATQDITLYAKWYEMSYSISYVLTTPGISLASDEIVNNNPFSRLASETTYISPPSTTVDTFTFDGWYFDSEYTKKCDFIASNTTEDVTLYAKWVSSVYTIQYDLGAVSQSVYTTENPNPESYKFGTELILADAVTKDPCFIFEGWYSDEFFTEKIDRIDADSSGDIILYAKWNTLKFNINYVLADNSGIDENAVHNPNPDTFSATETLILSAPVTDDKNYEFAGWYTSPDFSSDSKITQIAASTLSDITLYAKWEKAVYKITYDYGIINVLYYPVENTNPETYGFGDNTALSAIDADGFIFNGWCTDKALKNKVTAIPAESYGDITLYADFTEKTYSVTYELGYGEVTASQVVNTNATVRTTTEKVSLSTPQTINTEYEFGGWYLDSECTQEIDYIKAYTTGNITLYAKWIKIIVYIPCWGDATLSEQLSAADARLILRYASGLETGFTELQLKVSDINNDGNVNAADARIALRMASGLDNEYDIRKEYDLPKIDEEDGEIVFK